MSRVFGYPGGAVLPIYDAIFKQNSIRHILVRHEQGAVHAAEAMPQHGRGGRGLVTSGPGATNTVTGLTDALDGQRAGGLSDRAGADPHDRQRRVPGSRYRRHHRPCTKHNYLVKSGDALARVIHEAFHVARSGRPGPVVVDLPKDVLMGPARYTPRDQVSHRTYNPKIDPAADQVEQVIDLMAKARRPIFYVGGGLINAGPEACARLTELVRATGFPITLTLMGLGAYPASDPQFIGMLGMHGTYEAIWRCTAAI